MAIKNKMVAFTRAYVVKVDEKDNEESIIQKAMSEFNADIKSGLISANKDDFKCEIKYDWIF